MSVYSTEKLVAEARRLATDYRRATGHPLGISGEIAEFDAADKLDLELCKDRNSGYEAIGKGEREGKKIQIKGRAVFDQQKSGQRIGQLKTEQEWDLVVLVILDETYNAVEIFEADRETILTALEENKSSKRNKRGAMSLAKFKIISRLVWSREAGLIKNTSYAKQAQV